MKKLISQNDGDGRGVRQVQTEYVAKLEAKVLEQANEILYLKRKLNGIGGKRNG